MFCPTMISLSHIFRLYGHFQPTNPYYVVSIHFVYFRSTWQKCLSQRLPPHLEVLWTCQVTVAYPSKFLDFCPRCLPCDSHTHQCPSPPNPSTVSTWSSLPAQLSCAQLPWGTRDDSPATTPTLPLCCRLPREKSAFCSGWALRPSQHAVSI